MALYRPAAIGVADRDRHRAQLRLVEIDDPAPAAGPPSTLRVDAPSEPPGAQPRGSSGPGAHHPTSDGGYAPRCRAKEAQRVSETFRAAFYGRVSTEARRKLTQYRAALDDGADPATVSAWITEAAAEERAAQAELDALQQASPPALTVEKVMSAVTELRGLVSVLEGAEPKERAELYAALGVEITYQPDPRTAVLAVEPQALDQARVGGGT